MKTLSYFLLISCQVFLTEYSFGAIDFVLVDKNNEIISCDTLEVKNRNFSCLNKGVLLIQEISDFEKLVVKNNDEKFTLKNLSQLDYNKFEKTINNLNSKKIDELKADKSRGISDTLQNNRQKDYEKSLDRARQINENYKVEKCSEKFEVTCQVDCAANPYQYKTSCFNSCIRRHCH